MDNLFTSHVALPELCCVFMQITFTKYKQCLATIICIIKYICCFGAAKMVNKFKSKVVLILFYSYLIKSSNLVYYCKEEVNVGNGPLFLFTCFKACCEPCILLILCKKLFLLDILQFIDGELL